MFTNKLNCNIKLMNITQSYANLMFYKKIIDKRVNFYFQFLRVFTDQKSVCKFFDILCKYLVNSQGKCTIKIT